MKTATRLIALAVLLAGTFFVSSALACTTDKWLGTGYDEKAAVVGSPAAVSRVSGLCAMQLTAPGSVKEDTKTNAETTFIARFYVFAELTSGNPVIFQAFSDDAATLSLLTVTFDGTNFVFDAGSGGSGNVPGKSGWNLVELKWTGGSGMDYWVNADAKLGEPKTGTVAAAAGTIESVILGTSSTFAGKLTFDAYESHRSLPVGSLLIADADDDADVDVFDLIFTKNDILGKGLAAGQPDCNLNGEVDVFDLICTKNVILTQTP